LNIRGSWTSADCVQAGSSSRQCRTGAWWMIHNAWSRSIVACMHPKYPSRQQRRADSGPAPSLPCDAVKIHRGGFRQVSFWRVVIDRVASSDWAEGGTACLTLASLLRPVLPVSSSGCSDCSACSIFFGPEALSTRQSRKAVFEFVVLRRKEET